MKESCYNRKGMKTTHLCVYFGCLTGILSIECWYYWYCDYKKKCTYLFFHPFPDTVPKNLSICDVMRTIKVSFGMWSWWLWKTLMSPEKWKLKVISLSCFRLFATPWTVAYQAPLSMGFSKQECWSGFPCPSPGDLPDPGTEPRSPALAGVFFTTNTTWEVLIIIKWHLNILSYSKQVGREIVSRLNFLVEKAQNSPWNVIQIFIFMTGNLFKNPCNMHPLFRCENCRCLAPGHGMWVVGPGQDSLELQLIWYTTGFCQEIWKNR